MNEPTTITCVEELLAACADNPPGCISLHLDDDGVERCGTRATILDSLERWANDPSRLTDAAASTPTCGRRWVIFVRQHTPPNEHDASHYLDIAAALACEDVELIDCVIAWDEHHVSMLYLQHRTTSYDTARRSDEAA